MLASAKNQNIEIPDLSPNLTFMKIKVVVHKAEEGGLWAEVPSIPGCVSQGETIEELKENIQEAILGCLAVEIEEPEADSTAEVIELAV